MTAVAAVARPRASTLDFYGWMALACVATAFLGFVPTYWGPLAAGKFAANPIVHIHGLVMFSWTLFAFFQASLVSAGKVALHRAVGLVGISLATLVTTVAVLAALNSLRSDMAAGGGREAEAFLIVPLSVIVPFAALVALAIANIRRPEAHKRLMLAATISLLNAPVARPLLTWVWPVDPPPVWINIPACYLSYVLFVPALAHDWRTRGAPHRVYLIAIPIMAVLAAAVVPISGTAAWHEIARGFASLAGAFPERPA
ncbi:MAG TPA: hypothetical protein VGS12_02330 [Caulobacteraceae bacterium]|nr:hypothetical protein [Caulobacteraceae bacterium]